MKDIIIILDNIRSTQNVGAIMRTCDGAGITKLYLTGITPYPPHIKISKTALGAEEFIDWEYQKDILEVINELKAENYTIVAVEQTDKAINYYDFKIDGKIALIFGNEITGVEPNVLELCDNHISLPMLGKKNSLNVATTVGILAYHFKFNGK